MAAGYRSKAMVAGISCGLVTGDTDDDYIVLTDIPALEDFFAEIWTSRVARYAQKVSTIIQMDIKIHGLTRPIVAKTIARTRRASNLQMDEN